LTARGEELDRIIGLEVGADDYLAKPFNPRELLARIRAVLRRSCIPKEDGLVVNEDVYSFGDFTLNQNQRILLQDGEEIKLTHGEMSLLIILANHPNRILSRDQLMDMLSGSDRDPFDRSIDVRITRLRQKIEQVSSTPKYIRTVWGQGYRFTPDPVAAS
ncbi:MAG: two-component system response regulator OmpR, partial [Gammaproteobacteria bacterium]|nr:two-component system response regulator OmpR [Gammaproteobacteria bacterium]